MKLTYILFMLFISCLSAMAQSAKPIVTFYSIDEEAEISMSEGESSTCQAPLDIVCTGSIECPTGYTYIPEWRFFDTSVGESEIILTRYEDNTSYTLTSSGSYGIKLYVTFINGKDTIEHESEQITIIIIF